MADMSSGRFLEQLGYLFYVVSPNRTSFKTEEEVPDYVLQVIPHFVLLIVLEHFVLLYQGKQTFRINDGIGSVAQGILQELSKVVFRGFQMVAYAYVYENWRLATLPWNSPWTWFICFVAVDFAYYWLHRASHEINILWAAHQVHHSSEDYNLTTALRQSVFQNYSVWIFNLPLALAIPPSVFMVHSQFNLLYQFWIHTQTISTLGPLEYILNTPSHHRVHHGRNRYCIDKNYAGTLIVWDRLFGTFEAENEEVVYGLTHPLNTFESFYVQLCHYMHIWRTFWETKGFWNKLSVIFKGPGWSPGTPWHGNLDDIPDVKAPVEKFDPHLATWCKLYVLLHFGILIGGYVELAEMKQFAPATILWGTVAYEVFSLSVLGMLLEGRFYAPGIEVLRTFLYLAVDYFFLPYTATYRSALGHLWGMLSLRAIFASSFVFWLLFCLRNVTLKIHSKKLEKEQ